MEKYGVSVEVDDFTKTASDGCPKCGSPLEKHGKVLKCPKCGTEPFEVKDDAEKEGTEG